MAKVDPSTHSLTTDSEIATRYCTFLSWITGWSRPS